MQLTKEIVDREVTSAQLRDRRDLRKARQGLSFSSRTLRLVVQSSFWCDRTPSSTLYVSVIYSKNIMFGWKKFSLVGERLSCDFLNRAPEKLVTGNTRKLIQKPSETSLEGEYRSMQTLRG